MIKNLVFDIGNVLVEFKPKDYMERLCLAKNDIDNLYRIIFKDNRWNEFDRGTITIEKYITELKAENPQYSKDIDRIFGENWASNFLVPKQESISFLKDCSKRYNIYLLSNISEYVLDYVKSLDFWYCIKSGTYSYQTGSCKPEPTIYQSFLNDNQVVPEECLFLDDLPQNIDAARNVNMHGIVFHDNLSDVLSYLNNNFAN